MPEIHEVRSYRNPEGRQVYVSVLAREGARNLAVEGNRYVEISIEALEDLLRASGFTTVED